MNVIYSFVLGTLVLVSLVWASRRLFYFLWWRNSPRVIDDDAEDVIVGWFIGAWVAVALAIFCATAVAIGSAVLGQLGAAAELDDEVPVECPVTVGSQLDTGTGGTDGTDGTGCPPDDQVGLAALGEDESDD